MPVFVICALLLVAWMAYIGWPASLYAAGAALAAWISRGVVESMRENEQTTKGAAFAAANAIADCFLSLTIGTCMVLVAQLALVGLGHTVTESEVLDAEQQLLALRKGLSFLLQPGVLVALMVFCLFLGWRGYASAPLAAALKKRSYLSKLSGWLAIVCSFTFFSGKAVRAGEVRWVAARRAEAEKQVTALRWSQAELVASEVAKNDFAKLSDEDKSYLASFLVEAKARKYTDAIVEEKATEMAGIRCMTRVFRSVGRQAHCPAHDGEGDGGGVGGARPRMA